MRFINLTGPENNNIPDTDLCMGNNNGRPAVIINIVFESLFDFFPPFIRVLIISTVSINLNQNGFSKRRRNIFVV